MEIIRLKSNEARPYAHQLADLRLKVFWDFPYLYEGSLDYEMNYLETYFKAKNSFIVLIKDKDKIVGATTGILAAEEEESFRKPFTEHGLDVSKIFYFGESVLLEEYRGRGLGKIFFEERERFARSLGSIDALSFCAVVRSDEHPLKPKGHTPLHTFWKSQGFNPVPGLTTEYEWKDRGEEMSSPKTMQYWIKYI